MSLIRHKVVRRRKPENPVVNKNNPLSKGLGFALCATSRPVLNTSVHLNTAVKNIVTGESATLRNDSTRYIQGALLPYESGNGLTFVYPTSSQSTFGKLQFPGYHPFTRAGNAFSITFRIKMNKPTAWMRLISGKTEAYNTAGFDFGFIDPSDFFLRGAGTTLWRPSGLNVDFSNNRFDTFTVILNGADAELFQNGVSVATGSGVISAATQGTSGIAIGALPNSGNSDVGFQGDVDFVYMHERVLNALEVRSLHANPNQIYTHIVNNILMPEAAVGGSTALPIRMRF